MTPWTTAHQASLPFTIIQSLLKVMSIESVMPSNHLILWHPLLLLPSIFPRIRVFSNKLALCIRWPKYWSFSCSISPSNEYLGLISFRNDWFDLLAVQGTLKSLLKHHSSKESVLQHTAFFYCPALTSIHDWKNHSFDYRDLCWQSNVSDFRCFFFSFFKKLSSYCSRRYIVFYTYFINNTGFYTSSIFCYLFKGRFF